MKPTITPDNIDAYLAVAQWWKQLKATNNDAFLPLFKDQHRYLVLMGGGGSGKSIFAGRKILERATSEAGHRFLVCRKVARTLRESCYQQLVGQLREHYSDSGFKENKSDMKISFPNGSEIIFAGLDDVEKLKSIYNITGIWIEEASELLEADFNQLDIRLRGETKYYKQIIITFNPVSILHWLKLRFFDRSDERTRTHRSTYKDNRFLDAEAIKTLEAFKDSDEYYYTVYCLGEWGVTGKSVFDAKAVTERLRQNIRPVRVGYFEYNDTGDELSDWQFVDDKQGFIRIYTEPHQYRPYVIGGDTAGEGSDSFVGQVLDNTTGAQVATLRHTFDEDLYAKQMYCLGRYYNDALIGIESNYSTYPIMTLERLRYPRQYVRETVDTFTHAIKKAYGFQTTSKTRPVILSTLIKAAREDINIVSDKTTLEEMLTFVRNEEFRPEAEEGAHDDCVMALAIAHYIRPQMSYTEALPEPERVTWTEDMWEDYRNADESMRKYLIEKWGNPK
jgi:phage terminase large subunit